MWLVSFPFVFLDFPPLVRLLWTVWVDGLGLAVRDTVGMRVSRHLSLPRWRPPDPADRHHRIVEYATRDQAQNAVNTLSNQNLMGRLVYVREVHYS